MKELSCTDPVEQEVERAHGDRVFLHEGDEWTQEGSGTLYVPSTIRTGQGAVGERSNNIHPQSQKLCPTGQCSDT